MTTIHLVCGSTGAGKTTYATALAERVGGLRFSMDEWMATLFMPDQPAKIELAWMLERTARCEEQMWAVAAQALVVGTDVVFDVGLSRREHRDRFRSRAGKLKVTTRLHYLDTEIDTRRQRVRERNVERGSTYAFQVTDAMFDFMETVFEPPTGEELANSIHVRL